MSRLPKHRKNTAQTVSLFFKLNTDFIYLKHPVSEGGWHRQGHVAQQNFFARGILHEYIPMVRQLPEDDWDRSC